MQTFGANKKGSVITYIAMSLLIAASSSLFNPILSYYLNTEIGLSPLHISVFFILLPIATIIVVQTVARFSDLGLQRPAIICIASIFGIASSIILILRPSFYFLCTIGLLCLATYPASFSQIFASAREYSVKHMSNSVMFTTFLRALISLSWVAGPPIAYGIALSISFDMLFVTTSIMFILVGTTSFFFLPNVLDKSKVDQSKNIKWWTDRSVMLLCVATACIFTAFSSYITTLPLLVTQELKLPQNSPGYMMGLAAFLEIPIMFIAARLSRSIGLKTVVMIGALSLFIFLILIRYSKTFEMLMLIQFFSALFIGFVSSMGMVLFQELLPSIPGQATSLFTNSTTAGQILGGAMISLASSGSYLTIYEVGSVIALIGTILICFVKNHQK